MEKFNIETLKAHLTGLRDDPAWQAAQAARVPSSAHTYLNRPHVILSPSVVVSRNYGGNEEWWEINGGRCDERHVQRQLEIHQGVLSHG